MDEQEDEVWDAKKLAAFLGYSEETVRGYSTSKPDRLPPRLGRIRRPLWSKAAVMKWLADQSGMPAPKHTDETGEGKTATVVQPAPGFSVMIAGKTDADTETPVSIKRKKGRPRRPPP
ncbi:hypothetical protein [Cupriavidus alkaliphilus]|uniref:hypothetical protein n=1 Tax=Cupriavidus alkaliphilus TaxID=942866 RepID=UPI0016230FAC|nr:hypothetical protein [Cupriavidus alkaliphilus]MBB2915901.1 hypothetical protein [Cupriavidus alkaliphilus]